MQSKFIGLAVELAIETLEGLDVEDLVAEVCVADGNADALRLILERRGGHQPPEHRLIETELAGLGEGEPFAALGLEGADFILQGAGVIVDVDLGVADRSDALDIAREIGHAKAAEAEDQKAHQNPDGGFRQCVSRRHETSRG